MYTAIAIRLARGRWFTARHRVSGGERTQLFGPVHVSRPHVDTHLRFGRSVGLYQGVGLYLDAPEATITIGDGSYVNRRSEITCKAAVTIGERCAVSWDVLITDTDYHQLNDGPSVAPVVIGNHVWIGAKAVVLKGVTIGDGAVIAAGALVVGDVAPGTLVGGSPAKVLRDHVTWT